jgi:thymidylate synthase (FAD)
MAKVVLINRDEIENELRLAGWVAKVSSDRDDVDDLKVAKHCINSNHGTPTRGMRFVFEISEVSRAFSHEFVRHELGLGKVQRSQRYVKEDGFKYVTPQALIDVRVLCKIPIVKYSRTSRKFEEDGFVETWLTFDDFQNIVEQVYTGFINQGIRPEDARYALTNATFTKIRVVMNWEGLENFCYRRLCNRAQWEIRDVAHKIKYAVSEVNPFLGDKLQPHCGKYGFCPELPKGCGKAPNKARIEELIAKGTIYEGLKSK